MKKWINGLYNGNIAWMATQLPEAGRRNNDEEKQGYQAMLYHYDQLNRIMAANSLTNYSESTGFGGRTGNTEAYDASYSYDPNGNLLTLQRHDQQGNLSHDYVYEYFEGTNRLKKVTDVYTPEIPESKVYNTNPLVSDGKKYKYITLDSGAVVPSGNTAEINATENITINPGTIVESGATFNASLVQPDTVVIPAEGQYLYDEIGNLIRDNGEGTNIEWTPYGKVRSVTKGNGDVTTFQYDAAGNRIAKSVTVGDTTITTHYLRDASGNVMATYTDNAKEQPIYGSNRLGMYLGDAKEGMEKLGLKQYELSNHLGNVLAVITDNINIDSAGVTALVVSVSDYYPFGLNMPGRTFSADEYRYGFNGKEKDAEGLGGGGSTYDYGFRIYNPGIAKFLSVDPLTKEYPWYTPYQFAGNMPINAIDLDGLEWELKIFSPDVSSKFLKAYHAEEIDWYRLKELTNYWLDRPFEGDPKTWISKTFYGDQIPVDPRVMTLEYNPAVEGLTVHTSIYAKDGFAAWGEEIPFPESFGKFDDKYYPLDLRSSKAYIERYGDYYGDKDFKGFIAGGSKTVGKGTDAYLISGHLKGWGFVQLTSLGNTKGLDFGLDAAEIGGTYQLGDGGFTPYSLAGRGSAWSVGLGATYGKWKGYTEEGDVSWKGYIFGVTAGPIPPSFTIVESETKVRFPLKKQDNVDNQ